MNTHNYLLPAELRSLVNFPERPRLLVVDDQPTNIQLLHQIFQADHDVYMATSGEQAIEVTHKVRPDLILLDVMMPGMDGLTVCRCLKSDELTASIPVIFVTAQSAPLDETEALDAGGVDFIAKPVNPSVVRARVRTHLLLKAQTDLLRDLVFRDGLTMVANRRCFDDTLQHEWRRCRRSGASLTVLMIDIDHFKLFNDNRGHLAGDACLRDIADALQTTFRRSHDLVARYGGEEFVCLMPECGLGAGLIMAEQLRMAVFELNIAHPVSPTADRVTLSVGVAAVVPDGRMNADALVAAADAQLYMAKNHGRNRCSGASLDA